MTCAITSSIVLIEAIVCAFVALLVIITALLVGGENSLEDTKDVLSLEVGEGVVRLEYI